MSILGIDISKHNGKVDFGRVKLDGYAFVIVRAGYGLTPDPMFIDNVTRAIKAGLKVGAYWYAYWTVSPEDEVTAFYRTLCQPLENGEPALNHMEAGVWYDVEFETNIIGEGTNPTMRATMTVRGLDTLRELIGKDPNAHRWVSARVGLYCAASFPAGYLGNDSRLNAYPLWVAHWNVDKPGFVARWDIWQKCNTAYVQGVRTDCDVDEMQDGFLDRGLEIRPPDDDYEIPDDDRGLIAHLISERVTDYAIELMRGNVKGGFPETVFNIVRDVLDECGAGS